MAITIEQFRKTYPRNPMTISGLEVALFRAALHDKGISEHGCFGGRLKTLETDITIPYHNRHRSNQGVDKLWAEQNDSPSTNSR